MQYKFIIKFSQEIICRHKHNIIVVLSDTDSGNLKMKDFSKVFSSIYIHIIDS